MNVNDKCVGVFGIYGHKIKIVGKGIYKGWIESAGMTDKKHIYSHVHEYIKTEPYMQLENGMVYSGKDVRIMSEEEFEEIRLGTLDLYGKVDIIVTDAYCGVVV